MSIFLERFVLSLFAGAVLLLVLTNPMRFDWTQRITGAAGLLFLAYFAAHTAQLLNQKKEATPQDHPLQGSSVSEAQAKTDANKSVPIEQGRPGTTNVVKARSEHHAPKKEPQPPITIIQKIAPYGLLAKRCEDLGNGIFAYVQERNQKSPKDIGAHLDEYREWLIENDVWFRRNFYEAAKELQKDLGTNFKDPQLNALIAEYERNFASRQKEDPAYVRENAPMFHLSIEHIQEIGERFKYLAGQLREMSH